MDRAVKIQFKLPMKLTKRKKWYVASCPVLDVVTQGGTKQVARENLKDALLVFLGTCIEMGTIGDVLCECGFKPLGGRVSAKPKSAPGKYDFINVPIEILAQKQRGACQARCA